MHTVNFNDMISKVANVKGSLMVAAVMDIQIEREQAAELVLDLQYVLAELEMLREQSRNR